MCDEASKSPTTSNRPGGGQVGDQSEKGRRKGEKAAQGETELRDLGRLFKGGGRLKGQGIL